MASNLFVPLHKLVSSTKLLSLVTAVIILPLLSCASNETTRLPAFDLLEPATFIEAPDARLLAERHYSKAQLQRGKYLVELLGCGTCHTSGALVGVADKHKLLAGSQVGIAFSNPLVEANPGVVFPANLTSDTETGIGLWTEADIVQMLKTGVNQYGQHTRSVMPWQAYAKLTDDDAKAIAAYLISLPPVNHQVPRNVDPGVKTHHAYVHFGVYRKQATIK